MSPSWLRWSDASSRAIFIYPQEMMASLVRVGRWHTHGPGSRLCQSVLHKPWDASASIPSTLTSSLDVFLGFSEGTPPTVLRSCLAWARELERGRGQMLVSWWRLNPRLYQTHDFRIKRLSQWPHLPCFKNRRCVRAFTLFVWHVALWGGQKWTK